MSRNGVRRERKREGEFEALKRFQIIKSKKQLEGKRDR